MEKANYSKEAVPDEAANEAFKKSLFTIIDFGKLVGWCDEDNLPVPEDVIQSVKGDAQVLKMRISLTLIWETTQRFLIP